MEPRRRRRSLKQKARYSRSATQSQLAPHPAVWPYRRRPGNTLSGQSAARFPALPLGARAKPAHIPRVQAMATGNRARQVLCQPVPRRQVPSSKSRPTVQTVQMNKGVNMSVQLLKTNPRVKTWLTLLGVMLALTLNASAQFSSGSTGADGPLDFSNVTPGSVVIFDPTKFTAVPHVAGQNIFNFTTITIPANVTVVLSGQNLIGPVFWLAQGDVRINGHIALDGQPGSG